MLNLDVPLWLSGPLPNLLSLQGCLVQCNRQCARALGPWSVCGIHHTTPGGINSICLHLMLITLSSVSCGTEYLQLTVLINSTVIAATGGISKVHIHNSVELSTLL